MPLDPFIQRPSLPRREPSPAELEQAQRLLGQIEEAYRACSWSLRTAAELGWAPAANELAQALLHLAAARERVAR